MGVQTLCIECDETITEPICSSCLLNRMQTMIGELDSTMAEKIDISLEEEGDTLCIFCGRKMNLCAHCFSRDIYQFLEGNNEPLAEEFIGRFDFDLRRSFR
ncbi:hypothetical protein HYX12_01485 [Candidatus Woesearchaeota archaeon]|nr:hypothetical protein [Candidatus Woesearchaeota archaeon]